MDRTTATNYVTVAGKRVFVDRNLSTGVAGTTQTAADHTAWQEEIMAVIEDAGLVGDAGDNTQLLQAQRLKRALHVLVFTPAGSTLDGVAIAWANGGNWIVPAGVLGADAEAVGGGGGSGASYGTGAIAGAGGGGGRARGRVPLTPGAAIAIHVGLGGAAGILTGVTPSSGGAGGTTSIGSLMTALGGYGGLAMSGVAFGGSGIGGSAAGGQYNESGGPGSLGIALGGGAYYSSVGGAPGGGGMNVPGVSAGPSDGSPGLFAGQGANGSMNGGNGALGATGKIIMVY